MVLARQLTSLKIKGFKSFRQIDVQLQPLNVLVGANGAGKSNLVQFFDMMGALLEGRLTGFVALAGGASRMLYGGPRRTQEIEFSLAFGPNSYSATLALAPGDQLVFLQELCTFHDPRYERPYEEHIPGGGMESKLPSRAKDLGRVYRWVYETLGTYKAFHFHDTSHTAAVKQKQALGDNRQLRSDAANLAPYLFRVRQTHPATYTEIVHVIRLVAPFFEDFDLHPDATDPNSIQLEWHQKGSDQYFDAHSLSDGTLRYMCLAALLLGPDSPTTVVLDEPELGLHPFAIRQLAALLNSAASTRQIIAATQSVTLVDEFRLEDVVVVNRAGGASEISRLARSDLEAWLADYSLGELWDKNLLGGRPRAESS